MMNTLPKERGALDFIASTLAETGVSPSYQDIADAVGLKSKSNVAPILVALEAKGLIRRLRNKFRAIEVVAPERDFLAETPLHCFLAPLICIDRVLAERAS